MLGKIWIKVFCDGISMKIRAFDRDKDIHAVIRWFEDQEWPYPPVENLLPDMGVVSVDEGDNALACCFVYTTGTSLASVSWIGWEPKLDRFQKEEALGAILERIQKEAMEASPKIRLIEISTRDRSLEALLKEKGFWVKYGYYRATFIPPNQE